MEPLSGIPISQKDTYCLEMVQRKSARFLQSDYRHRSIVIRMLEGLKWGSLKDQRIICLLTIVFKILNIELAIPSEEFFEFNCTRTRHGHPKKLTRYQHKTDMLKYDFAPRTIPEWNDLPEEVVESKYIDCFRNVIWHNLLGQSPSF